MGKYKNFLRDLLETIFDSNGVELGNLTPPARRILWEAYESGYVDFDEEVLDLVLTKKGEKFLGVKKDQ